MVEVVEGCLLAPPLKLTLGVEELRDPGRGDVVDPKLEPPSRLGPIRSLVDRGELLFEQPRETQLRHRGVEHGVQPVPLAVAECCALAS